MANCEPTQSCGQRNCSFLGLSRHAPWLRWAVVYLHVFRAVVVGSCLMLVPIAWLAHIQWLLIASLCIATGELVESTYYILVLRWGQRTGRIA